MYTYELKASTSAAADFQTVPVELGDLQVYGIQVNFTGVDVVGSLKLQCSLDQVTWVDVAGSTQAVAASADHVWSVGVAGYRYVRVDWDYTSGTGNIEIKALIKENIVRTKGA